MNDDLNEEILREHNELSNDLKLDEINLRDTQIKLPAIKHKWVSKLINKKVEKNKLLKLKKETIKKILDKTNTKVNLSERGMNSFLDNHILIEKINDSIEMCVLMIENYEKIVEICRSATFDIKNLVELIKLENT